MGKCEDKAWEKYGMRKTIYEVCCGVRIYYIYILYIIIYIYVVQLGVELLRNISFN